MAGAGRGRRCAWDLCNALAAQAEVAAATGSGRSAASVAGGGGRLAADQRWQWLVGAGVVLGFCPRGLHNVLSAWAADQRRWQLVGAGGVLGLCPRGLGFALAARAEQEWQRWQQAVAAVAADLRQFSSGGRGLGQEVCIDFALAAHTMCSQLGLKRQQQQVRAAAADWQCQQRWWQIGGRSAVDQRR